MNTIEYRGQVFDRSHGSPFDRGAADSWYSRPQEPHWYPKEHIVVSVSNPKI